MGGSCGCMHRDGEMVGSSFWLAHDDGLPFRDDGDDGFEALHVAAGEWVTGIDV